MKPITKFVIIVCDQWRRMMHWPKVRLPAFERLKSDGVELPVTLLLSAPWSARMSSPPTRHSFTGRSMSCQGPSTPRASDDRAASLK